MHANMGDMSTKTNRQKRHVYTAYLDRQLVLLSLTVCAYADEQGACITQALLRLGQGGDRHLKDKRNVG